MIENQVSLKEYNTFGIDVQADSFCRFDSAEALREILKTVDLKEQKYLILGGGSNILLTRDFDGIVLKNEVMGIHLIEETDKHYVVESGAGENWHKFVMHTLNQGWAGLENLSLIPGNVGASPMQNIGAYGVEIKDRFKSLKAFHLESGEVHDFDAAACEFGYRESVFKRRLKGQYIILSVTFNLLKEPDLKTEYGAIKGELKAQGISNPTIKDVSNAVIRIRQSKLPDPAELGNAGSFFKNPVIPIEQFERISAEHPDIPNYPAGEGHRKLAAGWLIEKAGFKGLREGHCGMHAKQALVLVNYGDATGEEIFAYSGKVLETVKAKFGVELEREVNIV